MIHRLIYILAPPRCVGCRSDTSGLCERCYPAADPVARTLPTLRVDALGEYAGTLQTAVRALKDGRRDVGDALGDRLASLVADRMVLVPVRTTPARRRERGLDGATYLAQRIARVRNAVVVPALERRGGPSQRGRGRVERLAARGRFRCHARLVTGRRVVLIDDVCTTGATLEDCAEVLRASGARVAQAFTVAVANGRA